MKRCPKCNIEHNKNGNFCSRSCANSRTWSDEDKIKKSIAAKKSDKVKNVNRHYANNINRIEKYKKTIIRKQELRILEIIETPFDELIWSDKRIKIYHEQQCKCNSCGNDKWKNEKIPLELEHKDGNNTNNNRDNLELLCPNCHALTSTWRGRNKKGQRPKGSKVSDERLLMALLNNNWNMRQALIEVNLAPKGANYPRCHKIKNDYLK
jgi:5-methylcytosine-specific restriction endonuclease McrA